MDRRRQGRKSSWYPYRYGNTFVAGRYSIEGAMFKEFKEFAIKGNVLDLAVGVVIGASFVKIVTSFLNDILMPPIGLIVGKVDFSNLFLDLSGQHHGSIAEAKTAGAATLNYGLFINNII